MTALSRPPKAVVLKIATQEAEAIGASTSDVLSMSRKAKAHRARLTAWRRILAETGCTVGGLAAVWGCDRQAIRAAISLRDERKAKRVISRLVQETTDRLRWHYGAGRAASIIAGLDAATNADVAAWNRLGRAKA